MIAREHKRLKTVKKFAAKRAALKAILSDTKKSEGEKQVARLKLQKLPRDASPVRLQRRCQITGRPHAVYRRFGLSRNKLRELAMFFPDAEKLTASYLREIAAYTARYTDNGNKRPQQIIHNGRGVVYETVLSDNTREEDDILIVFRSDVKVFSEYNGSEKNKIRQKTMDGQDRRPSRPSIHSPHSSGGSSRGGGSGSNNHNQVSENLIDYLFILQLLNLGHTMKIKTRF